MDAEHGELGVVDDLLSVGSEEELRDDTVLLGVDDDEVGVDVLGIGEDGIAVVGVFLDSGDMADTFVVEELGSLHHIGAELWSLFGGLLKAEEVDFGAEEFGHSGSGRYFLARVDVDADGDDDAFEVFMEVEAFADGEDGYGCFLDDADGGTAHPIFLEAGGTVGADDNHGSVFVAGFAGDDGSHAAGADVPTQFASHKFRLIIVAQLFQFLFGQEGHDSLLLFVHEQFFAFSPNDFDAAMNLVGNVDGQVESDVRTFRKVCTYNN